MPYSYTAPAVMISFRYDLWAIAKKYAPEPFLDTFFIYYLPGYGIFTLAQQIAVGIANDHFQVMTDLLVKHIKLETPVFTGRLSLGIKPLSPVPFFRYEGMTERSWQVYHTEALYSEYGYYTYFFDMPDYAYFTNVVHTYKVPYGKPVEVGSRAHVAPAQNLRRWSLGHGGGLGLNEWSLQHEIASDGTPPKSMFYNGMIQFELNMRSADISVVGMPIEFWQPHEIRYDVLPTEFWQPHEIRYASTRDGTIDDKGFGFEGL